MPKFIVITGAASGIGQVTARRFAAPGASLALIARDRDGLEATAREVRGAGADAFVLAADVADADADVGVPTPARIARRGRRRGRRRRCGPRREFDPVATRVVDLSDANELRL